MQYLKKHKTSARAADRIDCAPNSNCCTLERQKLCCATSAFLCNLVKEVVPPLQFCNALRPASSLRAHRTEASSLQSPIKLCLCTALCFVVCILITFSRGMPKDLFIGTLDVGWYLGKPFTRRRCCFCVLRNSFTSEYYIVGYKYCLFCS